MNGLSWFFYLAELSDGVKVGATIGAAMLVFATPVYIVTSSETRGGARYLKRLLVSIFALALVAIVAPSSGTMYKIGASQIGEQILQLQEVQDLGGEAGALATDTIKLLRQMVSDQIETGIDK